MGQSSPLPALATIDHDRVILSSQIFQKARAEIEKKHKYYQEDLEKREAALRQLEATLRAREASLKPEEFSQQRQAFEQKVEETQKIVADRRRKLDDFFHKVRLQVVDKAMMIIQQLCQERSLIMVIPTSQIIYAIPSLDITAEVLTRLNAELPASYETMEVLD